MRDLMRMLLMLIATIWATSISAQQITLQDFAIDLAKADSVFLLRYPNGWTIQSVDSALRLHEYPFADSLNPVRLNTKNRMALCKALSEPSNFIGRFPTQRGFRPRQLLLLYNAGRPALASIYLDGHDISYQKDGQNLLWADLDPVIVKRIRTFLQNFRWSKPY